MEIIEYTTKGCISVKVEEIKTEKKITKIGKEIIKETIKVKNNEEEKIF